MRTVSVVEQWPSYAFEVAGGKFGAKLMMRTVLVDALEALPKAACSTWTTCWDKPHLIGAGNEEGSGRATDLRTLARCVWSRWSRDGAGSSRPGRHPGRVGRHRVGRDPRPVHRPGARA